MVYCWVLVWYLRGLWFGVDYVRLVMFWCVARWFRVLWWWVFRLCFLVLVLTVTAFWCLLLLCDYCGLFIWFWGLADLLLVLC